MIGEDWAGLAVAVLLLGYLFVALIRADKTR